MANPLIVSPLSLDLLTLDELGLSAVDFVPASTFVPSDVPGLQAWLESDQELYQDAAGTIPATADGHPVGRWSDLTGLGNHATQATTAAKPTLKLNIQNGLPVVRGDGGDILYANGAVAALSGNDKPFTVILVTVNITTALVMWAISSSSSGQPFHFFDTRTLNHKRRSDTGVNAEITTSEAVGAAAKVVSYVFTGTTGEIFHNGVSVGSGPQNVTILTLDQMTLFGRDLAGTPGDRIAGDIAAALVYDSALSVDEREAAEGYVNAKYGVF